MNSSLSPTQGINPILLNTLSQLYSIRASVINGSLQKFTSDEIETLFQGFNGYTDGRGIKIMKKFDEAFQISFHKAFPEKQYELLNTTFLDSIYVTSVLETHNLIVEINDMIGVFEEKSNSLDAELTLPGRSSGIFVELEAKKIFDNWKEYLMPFGAELGKNLEMLQVIPLGSNLETKDSKLQELFKNEIAVRETKILNELNHLYPTKIHFTPSKNRINSLAQLSPLVELSSTLCSLATVCSKIANDVRFLSSGPRSGYGELKVPENEPGSSIMPGKVNPTQCEALSMVSAQVIGNHVSISIANESSLFESSNFKPLVGNNLIRSIKLLADGIRSFRKNCAVGIELIENKKKGNF